MRLYSAIVQSFNLLHNVPCVLIDFDFSKAFDVVDVVDHGILAAKLTGLTCLMQFYMGFSLSVLANALYFGRPP